MSDEQTNINCILNTATKIAQGNPITSEDARYFCNALHEYFSRLNGDEKSIEVYKAVADATRLVVDTFGLPPGYKSKFESGVDDETRIVNVMSDHESAIRDFGMTCKLPYPKLTIKEKE